MTGAATLLREGLVLLAVVGGPLLAALLLVGLGTGVLQAVTQVNDPAVSFLPRLLATFLVLWLLGRWMVERLSQFLAQALERMSAGGV